MREDTYQLRDGVTLDDLMHPSEVRGIESPSPPSDYTTRFPSDARPGDRIKYADGYGDGYGICEGVVIDRAPQGLNKRYRCGKPCTNQDHELGGYWLWVQPDDSPDPVRVRYWNRGGRKGQARRDDGPMVIRSILGEHPFIVDHVSELPEALGVVA